MVNKGRNFEYRVKYFLEKNNLQVIRNYLSRKPDLIIKEVKVPFLECKKKIKKGRKDICYVVKEKDIVNYLKNPFEIEEKDSFILEDRWYTITEIERKLVLIIPERIDLGYIEEFLRRVEFFISAYRSFLSWYR
ncbi:MAG: hypothetical protein QXR71_04470 [Candidatus Aenigmatarchaeota archaeon]